MLNELHIDSIQQPTSTTTSIERDKINYQLRIEIFDRLLKFGIESVKDFIFYFLIIIKEFLRIDHYFVNVYK